MSSEKPKRKISQRDFILKYLKTFPCQELTTKDIKDWVEPAYEQETGVGLYDPNRYLRRLYVEGILQRVRRGVYVYRPDAIGQRLPPPFTESQKAQIFERDGRICAVCGTTEAAGDLLEVDHIQTLTDGGVSIIENGQVLCNRHNRFKKDYGHTETAKRFFRNLYRLAVEKGDKRLMAFIEEVMEVYERHGINDHIDWDPENP